MVSTVQLLDFLKTIEGEANGINEKVAELDAEKQAKMPTLPYDVIKPLKYQVNDIKRKRQEIKWLAQNTKIYLSKNSLFIKPVKTDVSDYSAKIEETIQISRQLINDLKQGIQVQEQVQVKANARKPLYVIAGALLVGTVLGGISNGSIILFIIFALLVPALGGFGIIELKSNTSGFMATIGRLAYIAIGAIYFLVFGYLTIASLAGIIDGCSSSFICFSRLYFITMPITLVSFFMACWMLWKGIRNQLPKPMKT